jgi:hypothetical protein
MTDSQDTWPLVDSSDTRPAGPSTACFYCNRPIGERHDRECVLVVKRVALTVKTTIDDRNYVGTWELDQPHFWSPSDSEFHKNEGTWCANNLLYQEDEVVWQGDSPMGKLRTSHKPLGCLCGMFTFYFQRVVDDKPRKKPARAVRGE